MKQFLYGDTLFAQRPGLMTSMFPNDAVGNRAICVPGVGSTKPFSALVVDTMANREVVSKGQYFPRYRYEVRLNPRTKLRGQSEETEDPQTTLPGLEDEPELHRVDNIPDRTLRVFQTHYCDNTVTKDRIFDYVYGVLHAPDYRERFATDLAKGLPRVPLSSDFHAFADAGRALSDLHVGYERCAEYPLTIESSGDRHPRPEHLRLGRRAMRFKDDEKTVLELNEHAKLTGIPSEAHEYQVNGRTPLEWFIDRYRIVQDKESGIVNDPNRLVRAAGGSDRSHPAHRSRERGDEPNYPRATRSSGGGRAKDNRRTRRKGMIPVRIEDVDRAALHALIEQRGGRREDNRIQAGAARQSQQRGRPRRRHSDVVRKHRRRRSPPRGEGQQKRAARAARNRD